MLQEVCQTKHVPLYQVDSHSVVPTWIGSNRLEVAARTLRPRLHTLLKDFATPYPILRKHTFPPSSSATAPSPPGAAPSSSPAASTSPSSLHELPSEERLLQMLRAEGPPPVDRWTPGTQAGLQELRQFCSPRQLADYENSRNDPLAETQSNLSPYLHFGQLSQQRCLHEVLLLKRIREATGKSTSEASASSTGNRVSTQEPKGNNDVHTPRGSSRNNDEQGTNYSRSTGKPLERKNARLRGRTSNSTGRTDASGASMTEVSRKDVIAGVDAFIEEAVVRCALSENFVFYCGDKYDSLEGAPRWAQESLSLHKSDPRVPLYELDVLEAAETYDALWNASQLQMMREGKMHGYLRMYWAKKMLEWMTSPAEALAGAIYLNDKYSLDGTDPNGYVGCLWSIGALHDQPFKERPIFGKVRYMNYAGCQRKFNVNAFLQLYKGSESSLIDVTPEGDRKSTGARKRRKSSGIRGGEQLGHEAKKKASRGAERLGKALLMTVQIEDQPRQKGIAPRDEGMVTKERGAKGQQKRCKSVKREQADTSENVERRMPQKVQKKLERDSEIGWRQGIKEEEKTSNRHQPKKKTKRKQER